MYYTYFGATISRAVIALAPQAIVSTNLGWTPFSLAAASFLALGISTTSPTWAKPLETTQLPWHFLPLLNVNEEISVNCHCELAPGPFHRILVRDSHWFRQWLTRRSQVLGAKLPVRRANRALPRLAANKLRITTAILRTRLGFVVVRDVEVGCFPRVRAYATAADTRSPDCFIGASTIRATPMIPSAATANSNSPRSLAM